MNKKKIRKIVASSLTVTMTTISANCYLGNSEVYAENKSLDCEKVEIAENIFKSDSKHLKEEFEVKRQEYLEAKRIEEERIQRELEEQRRIEEERIALEEFEKIRKESIGVNLDNLLEKSYIKAEELYSTLVFMGKTEMAELSWAIVDAENETGINSLFLTGLIAQESSWNKSYRAINQNNVTGYAIYNSEATGCYFNSKYDCIMETARWLKKEYLTEGGNHFYGYSSYHVNIDYCLTEDSSASDFEWSKNINNISKTVESYFHKYIK